MRAAHLKIAMFILFLAAPVATLLAFGTAESHGRAWTTFPSLGEFLLGKKGRLDQFGDAVLEGSIMQRTAVQVRNWTGYRLVGFVDNGDLVSGNDGWLFYRREFNDGRCIDEQETARRLRVVASVIDVGRAAGIDMVFSMSPDKSVIYPEALSATVRGYWRCRAESGAALRRLIAQELPDLIDHTEALRAEKARHPDIPLYFVTDTHWTRYGGAVALRHLLESLYPDARIPPARWSGATVAGKTDLARMLLLPIEERGPVADPLLAPDLELPRDRAEIETLIVHDSFYVRIKREILDAFPDPATMIIFNETSRVRAEGLSADRLIINVVERKFLLDRDLMTWDEDIPVAIATRNMQRAQACGAFGTVNAVTDSEPPAAHEVAIRSVASGQLPCLRLSVTATERTDLVIALPDPETGVFEPDRTLEHRLKPGTRTIAFILPGYTAGSRIQVSSKDAAISAIEVGEISASVGAVGQP
jgi:hypothetical protein